jgi:hypothetical protein
MISLTRTAAARWSQRFDLAWIRANGMPINKAPLLILKQVVHFRYSPEIRLGNAVSNTAPPFGLQIKPKEELVRKNCE